jgi:hypothetical protein
LFGPCHAYRLDLTRARLVQIYDEDGLRLASTLPLFASGLVGLGLLGWRRKNKALAA